MAYTPEPNRATIEAARAGLYSDILSKPPPRTESSVIRWVRTNLFSSVSDTIITIISAAIAIYAIVLVTDWAITDANWFVITRNIRQFMSGNYPAEHLWRLALMVLLIGFALGFTLYAYTRISRIAAVVGVALIGLTVIVPPVVNATLPEVPAILSAGSSEIASGTVAETPIAAIGFIGAAGETITISLAPNTQNDETLTSIAGFTDRAANAVINNARRRLTLISDRENIQEQLRGDLLTANQRTELADTLSSTEVPEAVTEAFHINAAPVHVRVLAADLETVIADATLDSTTSPLEITLPDDGWYALEKTVNAEDTVILMQVTGIYPLIELSISRPLPSGGSQRIEQFTRITDDFTTEQDRPLLDGRDIPAIFVTDHQYRGQRAFGDYLRMAGAPFLTQLSNFIIPFVLAGVVGYGVSGGITSLSRRAPGIRPPKESITRPVQTATTWVWLIVLIISGVLIYGIRNFDLARFLSLISLFMWVGWMYFVGIHANRPWGRALVGLGVVIGFGLVILNERLVETLNTRPMSIQFSPTFEISNVPFGALLAVLVWLVIGIMAARRGANERLSWQPNLATRGLIGSTVLWIVAVIGAFALVSALVDQGIAEDTNLLRVADPDTWGGLLLTVILTVVAIVASFPIGVLLALGRRSNLPVVKYACILFIELVRGVPLISILFMAQALVPLVNPAFANVPGVMRALVGLSLFSAAYLAENVRGGLQSIPHGQEEAAKAVGLNAAQITLFITLPQALRAVIPALVGQCIALFKDTTLVALVGLRDLLGIATTTVAQPEYIGLRGEVYLFISLIYFIGSYAMAYVSRKIEFSGSGASNNRNV